MTEQDAAIYWQGRYSERDQIWSGNANVALVSTVSALRPGRALDLGCGEGGDSIWLAEQGWQVTAVDIAENAVERARVSAAAAGIGDERVTWLVEDLSTWEPTATYDLVSACFLHSPVDFPRSAVLRRTAGALSSGGHLLIVGHAEPPPWADEHRHGDHQFLGPDEELVSLQLDGSAWEPVVSELQTRRVVGPEGEDVSFKDAVVLLRRR